MKYEMILDQRCLQRDHMDALLYFAENNSVKFVNVPFIIYKEGQKFASSTKWGA